MRLYASVWACRRLYAPICACMRLYAPVCAYMRLYASMCASSGLLACNFVLVMLLSHAMLPMHTNVAVRQWKALGRESWTNVRASVAWKIPCGFCLLRTTCYTSAALLWQTHLENPFCGSESWANRMITYEDAARQWEPPRSESWTNMRASMAWKVPCASSLNMLHPRGAPFASQDG